MAIKTLYTDDNYKRYLSLVRSLGEPYTITRSNYTLKIESESINVHFTPRMDKKAFTCSNMIRGNLKSKDMPEINKADLHYFNFAHEEILRRVGDRPVYNIDLKSAYANVLKNKGLIEERTFGFLSSLSKKNRLAAVGMLAAKKDVFKYDENNDCISHDKIIKDTDSWFYMCVMEVQNIMMDIKRICGHSFLFYWVDGVFYHDGDATEKIAEYLTAKGYAFSYDVCRDFSVIENNGSKAITFNKSGETKTLNMPAIDRDKNNYLLKFLGIIK